jgi:hypothetical protein
VASDRGSKIFQEIVISWSYRYRGSVARSHIYKKIKKYSLASSQNVEG